MPDLTIHTGTWCQSNESWETTVAGSKPGTEYTVSWGRDMTGTYQYDYRCTCKGFQFRGTCKHIKQVRDSGTRCKWNWEMEPGATADNGCCPSCGSEVSHFQVGV